MFPCKRMTSYEFLCFSQTSFWGKNRLGLRKSGTVNWENLQMQGHPRLCAVPSVTPPLDLSYLFSFPDRLTLVRASLWVLHPKKYTVTSNSIGEQFLTTQLKLGCLLFPGWFSTNISKTRSCLLDGTPVFWNFCILFMTLHIGSAVADSITHLKPVHV